jgi:hypothetical protein
MLLKLALKKSIIDDVAKRAKKKKIFSSFITEKGEIFILFWLTTFLS